MVLGFISGDGPVMVTTVNRKRRLTRLKIPFLFAYFRKKQYLCTAKQVIYESIID